jgi:gluconate 2-dehydrogenase gamma chain
MAEKEERLPNPESRIPNPEVESRTSGDPVPITGEPSSGDRHPVGTRPNPQPQGLGRRDMLKVLGAVPAAGLAPLATAAMPRPADAVGHAAAAPTAYQPKVLDPHEWKTIQVLSDIIIPADDRSGSATQAGVPEFIDDWLGFKEQIAPSSEEREVRGSSLLAQIRGGIIWLDAECDQHFNHDFVDCAWEQQKQILDRIAYPKEAAPEDAAGVAFFNHLRDLVVGGFFSSEMGVKDLPYLGNQMVSEWNGCPPNVLAKLELNKLVPGK